MAIAVIGYGLDCRKCIKEQKIERGCEGESTIPGRWQIEGEAYSRCPVKLVNPMSYEYIRAYNFYKNGYLPNGKGWLSESTKFIQAITVIEKYSQKEK